MLLFHRQFCTCISLCAHMRASVCVWVHVCKCACHLLPGECCNCSFSLVFLFFFLFYFLKIIFPFRNKFTRKPAPLPPRWTGHSHFSKQLILPHIPKQELGRVALEGCSLSLSGGMPWWRVKAPLPQWRFLIVGHSLVFVFFLSSN